MDEGARGVDVLDRPASQSVATPPRQWYHRLTRQHAMAAAAVAVVVLIAVAIAIGGGGGGSGENSSSAGSASGGTAANSSVPAAVPSPAVAAPDAAPDVLHGQASGTAGSGASSVAPVGGQSAAKAPSAVPSEPGAKVVKTGEMDLQVDKGQVGHTLDRLTGIATLERGFVADSHSSEGGDASGSMTLRVPVAGFEDTLTQVRRLGAKVLSVQVSGQDVTAQYVDLNARLRALTATRSSFERLLGRASTIGETLEVQAHITDVQTQIEQLQGQIRVLDDQSSFGTLAVTVDQGVKPVAVTQHHRGGMSAAVHRSVSRFVNGIEAIIGILGPLLLVVLLVGVVAVVSRVAYRLVRRQLV